MLLVVLVMGRVLVILVLGVGIVVVLCRWSRC